MSVSDDVILEQTEYTFDAAGNAILAVTRDAITPPPPRRRDR